MTNRGGCCHFRGDLGVLAGGVDHLFIVFIGLRLLGDALGRLVWKRFGPLDVFLCEWVCPDDSSERLVLLAGHFLVEALGEEVHPLGGFFHRDFLLHGVCEHHHLVLRHSGIVDSLLAGGRALLVDELVLRSAFLRGLDEVQPFAQIHRYAAVFLRDVHGHAAVVVHQQYW